VGATGADVLRVSGLKRLLGALSLAALVALTACGGDSLSPEAAVAEAASKTSAESARLHYIATAGPMTIEADGAFSDRSGRLRMDMSGVPGGSAFGDGDIELVFEDNVVYIRFPGALANELPTGKRWVSLDLEELGERAGIDFAGLQQFSQSDPTQVLEYLRGATDDFERVGEEDVRGTLTTHHRGTVDLRKVADQVPDEVRPSYERVMELAGTSEIPVEAWIDEEGRARRLTYGMPLPQASGGATMTITMEFFEFGADVSVEPPPDNEVVDLVELMEGS
jgi:hypothetical protein